MAMVTVCTISMSTSELQLRIDNWLRTTIGSRRDVEPQRGMGNGVDKEKEKEQSCHSNEGGWIRSGS